MKNIRLLILLFIAVAFLSCSELHEEHYKKAQKLFGHRDPEAALDELNKAIDINPDYAEAYFLRGICKQLVPHTNQGIIARRDKTLDAISDFDNAAYISLIKNDTALTVAALFSKGALQLNFDTERAKESFQTVIKLNYLNKDTFKYLSESYMDINRDATQFLSHCYIDLGDTLAALNVYERLLSRKPTDAKSYYLSAVNKIMLAKNKAGACEDLHTALSKYDSTDIYNMPNFKGEIENLIRINCGKK